MTSLLVDRCAAARAYLGRVARSSEAQFGVRSVVDRAVWLRFHGSAGGHRWVSRQSDGGARGNRWSAGARKGQATLFRAPLRVANELGRAIGDRPRHPWGDDHGNRSREHARTGSTRSSRPILTSFDTSYAWNYGSVKEGLRDLYEKAKREQWNGTTQLAWNTQRRSRERDHARPRSTRCATTRRSRSSTGKELARARHAQLALQLSQFLHGEQGALIVASQLVGGGAVDRGEVLRGHADDGRGAPRRGVQPLPAREDGMGVADQRIARRSCSTRRSATAAGTSSTSACRS